MFIHKWVFPGGLLSVRRALNPFVMVMFCRFQAYRAAMQTQLSWILQLCSCVEQHLKENAIYSEVSRCIFSRQQCNFFGSYLISTSSSVQFFSDAKESTDYLKSLQDSIQRKYSCDQTSSLHRLEDLIQESMVN